MKDSKFPWETGEALLMPDQYDLDTLLEACNRGQLEIYDKEKKKRLIPLTQLKPIKRIFDTAIAFDIPMTSGPTYSLAGFHFQEPSDPVWKRLFSQKRYYCECIGMYFDCWQSAVKSPEVNEWHFRIPDQLGNYEKISELQLREGERYELPFVVTVNGSGPDLLFHPEQNDLIQYTYSYYPDKDGVVGAFTYEPEQCVMQGIYPFLSFQKTYSKRMQIWFERLNETNDINWYAQISTRTFL